MAFKREVIIFVYFINLASFCLSAQSYSADIEKLVLSPITDPTWFTDYTLRTTKIAKNTFAVSGGVDCLRNLGNDIKMNIAIYKKDSFTGKYFSTPIFVTSSPTCKTYDEVKLVDDIIAASNLPPKGTCPIPKAKYFIDSFTLSPENLPGKVPPGSYRIELSFVNDQKLITALDLFVTIKIE